MKKRSAVLAAITDEVEAREPFELAELRLGAEMTAEQLGYRVEIFRVRMRSHRYKVLDRMLGEAGVAGVLILPTVGSVELTDLLDWSRFPVVSMTHQVTAPEFHRVGPDHFGNTLCLCQHLVTQGHRRLVYIADKATDPMVGRGLISAVQWMNAISYGDTARLSVFPRITTATFQEWLDFERPDVIITDTHRMAEKLHEDLGVSGGRPTFATYAHAGSTLWPGIDQHYRIIGAAAVNQLHSRIWAKERGVPEIATNMTYRGEWIDCPDQAVGGMTAYG